MSKPLVSFAHIAAPFRKLGVTLPCVALAMAAGCLDRPISPAMPTTTNLFVHTLPNHVVDKADLLFMIDNSMSMADKQQILAKAVPVLVRRLATPRCLDDSRNPTGKVSDAAGHCDSGHPEFTAVKDIHVGIVTSSLGSHGGSECQPRSDDASTRRTPDDRAELLPTANPAVRGNIDSWNQQGFLAWDPTQTKNTPPGDGDIDHFSTEFGDQVQKAGENGCGFEASLEAWYRFLIDPAPPASFSTVKSADGYLELQSGPVNQTVLAQRKAFLRPDSLLAIVMLTDENDCSINDDDGSQGWLVTQTHDDKNYPIYLPRASAACATSPDDACCRSCAAPVPSGCPSNDSDAECKKNGGQLTPAEDNGNLRCFAQKRRFGLDLLYPLERYVDGLTKSTIRDRSNQEVPNPIFAAPAGEPARSKDLVLLAGIVGVPWQDIATDDSLTGDGLTYLTAAELTDKGRWPLILGDSAGAPPSDPLMQESIAPRSGTNPILNAPLIAPNQSGTNPINGHEQNVVLDDDLQYACIFPLPTPRPCTDSTCDCTADVSNYDRPLCSYPNGPTEDGTQLAAKAYPGLRELGVIAGVKDNGIVASICPKHTQPAAGLSPEADASYGYNPAVAAMGNIISSRLAHQCLPRPLSVETDAKSAARGEVPCAVVEALPARAGSACSCDASHGRIPLGGSDDKLGASVYEELASEGICDGRSDLDCHDYCLCKIAPLAGSGLTACQNGTEDSNTYGYCYIDPAQGIGDPALVADCPATAQRSLRFVGDGLPANGSVTFMACYGSTLDDDTSTTPVSQGN
jgi:hypothetical protein